MNITPFGLFHTLISLAAVILGIVSIFKYGEIGYKYAAGRGYIWLTVASCVTGLFIFHHGGFGPPHALAILTLLTLVVAFVAGTRFANGIGRYVSVLAYSFTLFLHMIPGLTETFTRLPQGSPLFSGPDDSALKTVVAGFFVAFLIGAIVQVVRMRKARQPAAVSR